ncbi:MAG: aminotransferase class I/II-fold pyridoxal phosphate-dependent enzyme [Lachnospiraceae bacterium]|nr:aminotransferase class I/II-fold pyridoxal phosphate-dependent enzyme [Lachnospiraceae bacterium]
MEFDFETWYDRKGMDAIAVDSIGDEKSHAPAAPKEGVEAIPMWVADMNFATCPSVTEAINKRTAHPLFGYFEPREEYFSSVIRWQKERFGVENTDREQIGYENGVLGGVVSALRAVCAEGESVLLHSPYYIGFYKTLRINGFQTVLSGLKRDAKGVWHMDYEDMEKKIAGQNVRAVVFCSPHNPTGRVWESWELKEALAIFERHHVWIVSDEIWADITLNGHRHIPLRSVNEYAASHTVSLYAVSKTFNLAGLVGSYHIIPDERLRERQDREAKKTMYNSMNVLSMAALIGAYTDTGARWVDELCQVLSGNINFAYDFIEEHFPGISCFKPEGTYMLFLQCEPWCAEHKKTRQELLKRGTDEGVAWQDGGPFGDPFGIRMNLALPRRKLEEALLRLDAVLNIP